MMGKSQTTEFLVGKNMKPQGVAPAIALCNPKYARNVSMVLRIASCYGIKQLWYSGDRVSLDDPSKNVDFGSSNGHKKPKKRLPREERMKGYAEVELRQFDKFIDHFPGAIPIAVELKPGATKLTSFEHPANALYIFGPEDGSIPNILYRYCHHFVVIPTRHCLNLATSVSTVLYDRYFKAVMNGTEPDLTMDELLYNDRVSLRQKEWEDTI